MLFAVEPDVRCHDAHAEVVTHLDPPRVGAPDVRHDADVEAADEREQRRVIHRLVQDERDGAARRQRLGALDDAGVVTAIGWVRHGAVHRHDDLDVRPLIGDEGERVERSRCVYVRAKTLEVQADSPTIISRGRRCAVVARPRVGAVRPRGSVIEQERGHDVQRHDVRVAHDDGVATPASLDRISRALRQRDDGVSRRHERVESAELRRRVLDVRVAQVVHRDDDALAQLVRHVDDLAQVLRAERLEPEVDVQHVELAGMLA